MRQDKLEPLQAQNNTGVEFYDILALAEHF